MKLHNITLFLVIFNVVCCQPSSEIDVKPEKAIDPCDDIITPVSGVQLSHLAEAQVALDSHFPEVEYPTQILETLEHFYYRDAAPGDTLAPFPSDVKDAFKCLEAEIKAKEVAVHKDNITPNIQLLKVEDDGTQINEHLFHNEGNISDVSIWVTLRYFQPTSEEETETPECTDSQSSIEDMDIKSTNIPDSSNQTSVITQDASLESKGLDETVSLVNTQNDSIESKDSDETVSFVTEDSPLELKDSDETVSSAVVTQESQDDPLDSDETVLLEDDNEETV